MSEVSGKFLNLGNQSYKSVISANGISKNINVHEKKLNRHTVLIVKRCAEILRIKFNRTDLMEKILSRIDSMIPEKFS